MIESIDIEHDDNELLKINQYLSSQLFKEDWDSPEYDI